MNHQTLEELVESSGFDTSAGKLIYLSAGKGCELFHLKDPNRELFIKKYDSSRYDQVKAEADGLNALRFKNIASTPEVVIESSYRDIAVLAMDFISESSMGRNAAMRNFGHSLAKLHRETARSEYGYPIDNFIGALKQPNGVFDSWGEFYYHRRLLPQLEMAVNDGLMDRDLLKQSESWPQTIESNCPAEPACLIHGDLWAGNMIADTDGTPWMIDPAVSYAHREMDLAMTRLFGGFSQEFYSAYNEVWPIEAGFESRLPMYQLYYLLVHVNFFGRTYVGRTMDAIRRSF